MCYLIFNVSEKKGNFIAHENLHVCACYLVAILFFILPLVFSSRSTELTLMFHPIERPRLRAQRVLLYSTLLIYYESILFASFIDERYFSLGKVEPVSANAI